MLVVETLESRTLLSAALLSQYWPLQPGWEWRYTELGGSARARSTERISPETQLVHGERAMQRVIDDHDGQSISLENISARGRVQWHRMMDDSLTMTFTPAWEFPKYARVGERVALVGKVDMASEGIHLRGQYHVNISVEKMERIKVAAGTFNTVKIVMDLDISVEFHNGSNNASLHATGTDTKWLAKGIGKIKEIDTHRTESKVNGKKKVEENTVRDVLRSYTRPT
jgi:hypothetical protein